MLLKLILSADVNVGGIAVALVISSSDDDLFSADCGRSFLGWAQSGNQVIFGILRCLLILGCGHIPPLLLFALSLLFLLLSRGTLCWEMLSLLMGLSPVELWSVDTLSANIYHWLEPEFFTQEFSEAVQKIDHSATSEGMGISGYWHETTQKMFHFDVL